MVAVELAISDWHSETAIMFDMTLTTSSSDVCMMNAIRVAVPCRNVRSSPNCTQGVHAMKLQKLRLCYLHKYGDALCL